MSKSGRRRREEPVDEEVLERLPRWRRELLRMLERARSGDLVEDAKADRRE